ncbi:hypothetical protein ACFU6R_18380 [Streptomyces sp. NPDC057499]|uniref:hypothetical protein n=1 Tax=Streptomyces sp. NPDC057499 TaxID=3346150 RepID=UPI0036BB4ED4
MPLGHGLAVDWVSAESLNAPADMRFPGEILHVYGGGKWTAEQIAAIQLPDREIDSVEFVEPALLPDLMAPGDARRALSALRARINCRPRLAGERPPDLPHRPGPGSEPDRVQDRGP